MKLVLAVALASCGTASALGGLRSSVRDKIEASIPPAAWPFPSSLEFTGATALHPDCEDGGPCTTKKQMDSELCRCESQNKRSCMKLASTRNRWDRTNQWDQGCELMYVPANVIARGGLWRTPDRKKRAVCVGVGQGHVAPWKGANPCYALPTTSSPTSSPTAAPTESEIDISAKDPWEIDGGSPIPFDGITEDSAEIEKLVRCVSNPPTPSSSSWFPVTTKIADKIAQGWCARSEYAFKGQDPTCAVHGSAKFPNIPSYGSPMVASIASRPAYVKFTAEVVEKTQVTEGDCGVAASCFAAALYSSDFAMENSNVVKFRYRAERLGVNKMEGDYYDGLFVLYKADEWRPSDQCETSMQIEDVISVRGDRHDGWIEEKLTATSSGRHIVAFVAGSYDQTGGRLLGSTTEVNSFWLEDAGGKVLTPKTFTTTIDPAPPLVV